MRADEEYRKDCRDGRRKRGLSVLIVKSRDTGQTLGGSLYGIIWPFPGPGNCVKQGDGGRLSVLVSGLDFENFFGCEPKAVQLKPVSATT